MKHKLKYILPMGLLSLGLLFISTDKQRYWGIAQNMEIFADVYKNINSHYVEEPDVNQLMQVALDTMLYHLDPYTNYYSEAQIEQVRIDMMGGWDGVGVETADRLGKVVIKDIIEESAARKSGVRVGDVILAVDGNNVQGKKSTAVDKALNGKAGTKVSLKVLRPYTQKEHTFELTRETVSRKNVPYFGMLSDKETGYIVLNTFSDRAAKNILDAFKTLEEEHKPKQLILDLRENGGGFLMEAVSICNMFVPKGQDIVYAKSRLEEWNRTFSTKDAPHNTQIPLIVLVNENSASASEIVSGALQDLDRAVIVGRKSFGKGLVQNTKDIEAFRVQIKYTTAKYYIPSGRCIQALEYDGGKAIEIPDSLKKVFKTKNQRPVYDGAGISPDVKVEASKESAIARLLRYNLIISDFANVYYNQHDSIPPAKQFRLTEKEFEAFIEFVSKQPRALSETEKLVSQALAQKMENTSNENALKTIQTRLQTNQIADIRKNKPELMSLLEREIASRYYYENGRIEIQLRDDKDVQEAVNLFKDKAQFKKILGNE